MGVTPSHPPSSHPIFLRRKVQGRSFYDEKKAECASDTLGLFGFCRSCLYRRFARRFSQRSRVAASDDDYRLRCAPERYRMRVFRDFAKDIGDIAEAGTRVNFVTMPDFLNGVGEALKVIIEVGNRMQGICRRAKKSIKRHGNAFWLKLDEWNALRCAV